MTIWFNRRHNGVKKYCSKSVSVRFHPQHWKLFNWSTNGATKKDSCFDLNVYFLGIFFSYTNWDYNKC